MNYDFRNKKRLILKLIRSCPFQTALFNCPLKETRKLSLIEKLKLVANMSEQESERILEYHEKCSKERNAAPNDLLRLEA